MAITAINDVKASVGDLYHHLYCNCSEHFASSYGRESCWQNLQDRLPSDEALSMQLPQYMILTAKSYKATPVPRPSNNLILGDYLIAALMIVNLTTQFIADQQQWDYQNYKRGRDSKEQKLPDHVLKTLDSDPDVKRGFVTKGLWAYSRHPNFACEQTTWCVSDAARVLLCSLADDAFSQVDPMALYPPDFLP